MLPGPRERASKSLGERELSAKAREQVTIPKINRVPWRAICYLDINYEDGQLGRGTGFLVGSRTVITAGHCVHQPVHGRAMQVKVMPARQGGTALEEIETTMVDFSPEWQATNPDLPEYEHDYGAVFLRTSTTVGHNLRYAAFTDDAVEAIQVANVAGYPNHGDNAFIMEKDAGPLVIDQDHPINQRILYHLLDTYEGQSGGPIMHAHSVTKEVTVFGIHTYGDEEFPGVPRVARRIDQPLANIIRLWVKDPWPFMAGAAVA